MIEKFEYPPNYEEIKARFDIEGKPVVFTYGDTLYNPHKGHISPNLWVHEETHVKQQNSQPDAWWREYMANDQFRLSQEVEAYQNQYRFIKKTENREVASKALYRLARDLSSEIYGNIISHSEAMKRISS